MRKLQTNMPHADNIQDMGRTNRKKSNKNYAHTDQQQPIWIREGSQQQTQLSR